MSSIGRRQPLGRSFVERAHGNVLDSQNVSQKHDMIDIQQQEWTWVFSALYEAARAPELTNPAPHSITNLGSMKLRIPETVIFEQGFVIKWIGTGIDGRVVRRSIIDMNIDSQNNIYNQRGSSGSSGGFLNEVPLVISSSMPSRKKRRNQDNNNDVSNGGNRKNKAGELTISEIISKIINFFIIFANNQLYLQTNDMTTTDKEERPFAVIWYIDGQKEILSEKMFKYIILQNDWRVQVNSIQSFIYSKHNKTGYFESTKYRLMKQKPFSLSSSHDLGLNTLTMTLAQFAERAFADLEDENTNLSEDAHTGVFSNHDDDTEALFYGSYSFKNHGQRNPTRSFNPTSGGGGGGGGGFGLSDTWGDDDDEEDGGRRIEVQPSHQQERMTHKNKVIVVTRQVICSMKASFILDEKDTLWFSHCDEVNTKMIKSSKNMTSSTTSGVDGNNSLNQRSQSANNQRQSNQVSGSGSDVINKMGMNSEDAQQSASVIGEELRRLLLLAETSKVSIAESFKHFDERGVGLVDSEGLVDGLSRLGIGISDAAADVLLVTIAATPPHLFFNKTDLEDFVKGQDNHLGGDPQNRASLRSGGQSGGRRDWKQELDSLKEKRSRSDRQDSQNSYDMNDAMNGNADNIDGNKEDVINDEMHKNDTDDGRDLELFHESEEELFQKLFDERASVLLKKHDPRTALKKTKDIDFPGAVSFADLQEKVSLSPRTLDARDRPSLVNYAEGEYGSEGELRSSDGASLNDRTQRQQAKNIYARDAFTKIELSQAASEASKRTFKEIDGKYTKWARRKRNQQKRQPPPPPPQEQGKGQNKHDLNDDNTVSTKGEEEDDDHTEEGSATTSQQSKSLEMDQLSRLNEDDAENELDSIESMMEEDESIKEGQNEEEEDDDENEDEDEEDILEAAFEEAEEDEEMDISQSLPVNRDDGIGDEDEDERFHTDFGAVMTYRLIKGQAYEFNENTEVKYSERTVQQQRAHLQRTALKLTRGEEVSKTSFLLIAFPDVTTTLDAMASALSPLLTKHPDGALLLLGLPGLPNTTWPTSQQLTASHQAQAVKTLLSHLISTEILDRHKYIKTGVPVIWFGIGNGVSTMVHLATQQSQTKQAQQNQPPFESPSFSSSSQHNRTHHETPNNNGNGDSEFDEVNMLLNQSVLFVSCNGFSHVDSQLRKTTQSFQQLLMRGTYHERLHVLTQNHFSSHYIQHCGELIRQRAQRMLFNPSRQKSPFNHPDKFRDNYPLLGRGLAMRTFWKTRRSLALEPPHEDNQLKDHEIRKKHQKTDKNKKNKNNHVVDSSASSTGRVNHLTVDVNLNTFNHKQEDDETIEDMTDVVCGSEGIHASLKGMLSHPDLRTDLHKLPAPLLLISSNEDAWISPTHSRTILDSLISPSILSPLIKEKIQASQHRRKSPKSSRKKRSGSVASISQSRSSTSSRGGGGSSRGRGSDDEAGVPLPPAWSMVHAAQELVIVSSQKIIKRAEELNKNDKTNSKEDRAASSSTPSSSSGIKSGGSDRPTSSSSLGRVASYTEGMAIESRPSSSNNTQLPPKTPSSGSGVSSNGSLVGILKYEAGHEILQEKRKDMIVLLSDLITNSNEVFHQHKVLLTMANEKETQLYNETLRKKKMHADKLRMMRNEASPLSSPSLRRSKSPSSDRHGKHPSKFLKKQGSFNVLLGKGGGVSDLEGMDDLTDLFDLKKSPHIDSKPTPLTPLAHSVMDDAFENVGEDGDVIIDGSDDEDEDEDGSDDSENFSDESDVSESSSLNSARSMTAEERAARAEAGQSRKAMRIAANKDRANKKAEKQRQKEAAERKIELDKLRAEQELAFDVKREAQERFLMSGADKESIAMMNMEFEVVAWAEAAEGARIKAIELHEARNADEIRKLEFDAARSRSLKHAARVKRLREEQERVEKEELTVGDGSGAYAFVDPDGNLDIEMCGIACAALVNDLFEARQRLVNSIKRQYIAQEQYDSFKSQYEGRVDDISKARRQFRILERRIKMGDTGLTVQSEHDYMKKDLDKKIYALSELESLYRARTKMLDSANRIAQGLKIVVKERQNAVEVAVRQVVESTEEMTDRMGQLRLKTEKEDSESKRRQNLKAQMIERKYTIGEELKRVSQHPGKYINANVWNAGVTQRMETAHLFTHLSTEYRTLKAVIVDLDQMIMESKDRMMRFGERMCILDAQGRHIKRLNVEINKCYDRACSRTIVEELQEQEKRQADAEAKILIEKQEAELLVQARRLSVSGSASPTKGPKKTKPSGGKGKKGGGAVADEDSSDILMNITRMKPTAIRTLDEKAWIALDSLMNPEYYEKYVSEIELEEMKYDHAYQVWQINRASSPENFGPLTVDEVLRILSLPRDIASALPFLQNQEQIDMHRLLMKFTLGRGYEFILHQDAKSQNSQSQDVRYANGDNLNDNEDDDDDDEDEDDSDDSDSEKIAKPKKITKEDLVIARERVAAFLKEKKCMKIRCTPRDELTAEERMWVCLDEILAPEHYFFDFNTVVNADGSITNYPNKNPSGFKANASAAEAPRMGDKYESQRIDYELGIAAMDFEIAVDAGWVCPLDEQGLLQLRLKPEGLLESEEERRIKYLMDKYYVDPEFTMMGQERKEATKDLMDEVKVLAESQKKAELYLEEKLAKKEKVEPVPWLPKTGGLSSKSLNEVAKGIGVQRKDGKPTLQRRASVQISGSTSMSSPNRNFRRSSSSPVKSSILKKSVSMNEYAEEYAGDSDDEVDWDAHPRVWGSWDTVHPAALGSTSQREMFPTKEHLTTYNGGQSTHPASYSLTEPLTRRQVREKAEDLKIKKKFEKKQKKREAKLRRLKIAEDAKKRQAKKQYKVVPDLKALGLEEGDCPLLVPTQRQVVILEETNVTLEARKSRAHAFEVGSLPKGDPVPDYPTGVCLTNGQHFIDLTINITYQGVFGPRGYRVGRVAANMNRIPHEDNIGAQLTPVGFSPYDMQQLNTLQQHGKITILHCPANIPVMHSRFQVVVGAAAPTNYSITVTGRLAEDANICVERHLKYGKMLQAQLPALMKDLDFIWNSMRIFERKLVVTTDMQHEAEVETKRIERDMEMCADQLNVENVYGEDSDDEDERVGLFLEMRTLEVEFAHYARCFASRAHERKDCKATIDRLGENRRELLVRKAKIDKEVNELRVLVPPAVATVLGIEAASTAALDLNTSFTPVTASHKSKWARVAGMGRHIENTITPAMEVRRRHIANGFSNLSLDEKQWTMLDKSINPDQYTWIELGEVKERERFKKECEVCRMKGLPIPKLKKPKKINMAVRSYQFSKLEIERIMELELKSLSRKEASVRRLLEKFHDNAQLLRRKPASKHASVGAFFGHDKNEKFDPTKAQRVRLKLHDKRTVEEKEWVLVDQVVNPDVWTTIRGRQREGKPLRNVGDERLFTTGFVQPYPLEPELQKEIDKEKDIKAAADRAARRKNRQQAKLLEEGGGGGNQPLQLMDGRSSFKSDALAGMEPMSPLSPGSPTASMKAWSPKSPSISSRTGSSASSNTSTMRKTTPLAGGITALVQQAVKAHEMSQADSNWECHLDRDACLKIWATDLHTAESELSTYEFKIHQLLSKFNGPWEYYQEWMDANALRVRIKEERKAGIGHMRELKDSPSKLKAMLAKEKEVVVDSSEKQDIDTRCLSLQKELDHASNNSNALMESKVLHHHTQKFPTNVLRIELEKELDSLIRTQVLDRERSRSFLVEQDSEEEDEGEEEKNNENKNNSNNKGKKNEFSVHDDDDDENDEDVKILENAHIRAIQLMEHDNNDASDEEQQIADKKFKKKMLRRMRKRKEGLTKKVSHLNEKAEVHKAHQLISDLAVEDDTERQRKLDFKKLGFGACSACMSNPCKWQGTCNLKEVELRREALRHELHFVRMHPEVDVFDSSVPMSVTRGGSSKFRREDLAFTLEFEDSMLLLDTRLCGIDREFHDAHASTKEYVVVEVLHGYRTLLWRGSAIKALEEEHNKLIASQIAVELVEDILDNMREGWYFGEVKSKFQTLGYVPSVSETGIVRRLAQEKAAITEELEDMDDNGIPDDALEDAQEFHLSDEKAIKKGDHRDKSLNTTEQNIRFGLFTLTFMYFRSQYLMKKQRKMWVKAELKGEGITDLSDDEDDKKAEDPELIGLNPNQRKIHADKIAKHEAKVAKDMGEAITGQNRKNIRESQERHEASGNLYHKVRQENMEKAACADLQRIYRGHIGRKIARRWAMKKAEMEAFHALLVASAITCQRIYRGYLGKLKSQEVKVEMAEFIRMIRLEEAVNDQEEYWRKHPIEKVVLDTKTAVKKILIKEKDDDDDDATVVPVSDNI